MSKLDGELYNSKEIVENYKILIAKWGEWEIVGGDTAGLVVRYVDIKNAIYSDLSILYMALTITSLTISIIFGKIVFPLLSRAYKNNNEEMVDLATLKSSSQIDKISKEGGWF